MEGGDRQSKKCSDDRKCEKQPAEKRTSNQGYYASNINPLDSTKVKVEFSNNDRKSYTMRLTGQIVKPYVMPLLEK